MSEREMVVADHKLVITNISQLLSELSINFHSGFRRYIFAYRYAGDGGQWVRCSPLWQEHIFHQRNDDIAIESAGYHMLGFMKHEAQSLFPKFFNVQHADDGVWWSAELTEAGYGFAKAGVLDINVEREPFKHHPFFNAPSINVTPTMLTTSASEIGRTMP